MLCDHHNLLSFRRGSHAVIRSRQRPDDQIFRHFAECFHDIGSLHSSPSSLKNAFSFFLVRCSVIFTALTRIPVRDAIAPTGSDR